LETEVDQEASMPNNEFSQGDHVSWRSAGGLVKGKVVRKVTSPTQIERHKVAASPDNPEYVVKSERTGASAAHKPHSLKPLK
jgi:hypothetical protein